MTPATTCGHEQKIVGLRKELGDAVSDLAAAELARDDLEDELAAVKQERELIIDAADMAHAQHDGRTPRRLCRQEMCRLFDEAGVPDR